jgi:hypothetical protein
MERLGLQDTIFLEHNRRIEFPCDVQVILTTTKFEFREMQDFLFKAVQKEHKMMSKVTQFMGKFYYEQHDVKQWAKLKD